MDVTTSAQTTATRWHIPEASAILAVRPGRLARLALWPVLAMWVEIGDRLRSGLTTVGRAVQRSTRPFGVFNLDGFELGLTPDEVIADLDFGVGPIAETARLVQEDRPEVGRVA